MATYTSHKLTSLIQHLDTLDLPASFNRLKQSTTHPKSTDRSTSLQQTLLHLNPNPSRADLTNALHLLRHHTEHPPAEFEAAEKQEEDILEWTVLARVVLGLYGLHVEELIRLSAVWEDEIDWWKRLDRSGRYAWGGIGGYVFMTLPRRLTDLSISIYKSPPSRAADFTPTYLLSSLFPNTSIPRSTTNLFGLRTLLRMTRLEVHNRIQELEAGRNRLAARLGKLTVEAPVFKGGDDVHVLEVPELGKELRRVLDLVLSSEPGPFEELPEVKPERSFKALGDESEMKVDGFLPTLSALLAPSLQPLALPSHLTRPSVLTRLWPPLLLLPLLIPLVTPQIPLLKGLVADFRETAVGFWKGWVVEPVMGILDTVRHGSGESVNGGLMSKEGMKSDIDSLERMVIDLAKDKKHYSPDELANLSRRVREGDLTDVLKLYEEDMKSPLKNAIAGSLVRSLLIQVQKTKVDVDLALAGIDRLLRSQELTFAFVGVAPSFLIVYLVAGWLKAFLTGAGGLSFGANRREKRRKSWEGIRRIERLLLLTHPNPPESSTEPFIQEVPYETQGLLLVSIASLRDMARREFKRSEAGHKQEFLQDLLDLEDPEVTKDAKLAVVDRMWRSWGMRLEWVSK